MSTRRPPKLDPTVFLDAAQRLISYRATGCCGALYQAQLVRGELPRGWNLLYGGFGPASEWFTEVFKPELTTSAFWFDTNVEGQGQADEARLLALCFAALLAKDEQKKRNVGSKRRRNRDSA